MSRIIIHSTRKFKTFIQPIKSFSSSKAYSRQAQRNTISKIFGESTESSSDKISRTFRYSAIGSSAVGIGIIAWYGTAKSHDTTAIDRSMIWPGFVRERVKSTYGYFAASAGMAAATATAVFRSPTLFRMVARPGWAPALLGMAAVMGTGLVVRTIPYPESGFGTKHLAWMAHNAAIGMFLSPVCLMGGPLIMRAMIYTLGIVGGLSTIAVFSPSDQFLNIGGPLAMGLGVVVVSNIAGLFVNPVSALGAGLYGIVMYGGLVLFGGFMLYDTQMVVRRAEQHNSLAHGRFDPINNSIGIFMDTVNIFIRLVFILSGNKKSN